MQPHTIASYDAELKTLDALVGDMAGRAEASLEDATKALFAGNVRAGPAGDRRRRGHRPAAAQHRG